LITIILLFQTVNPEPGASPARISAIVSTLKAVNPPLGNAHVNQVGSAPDVKDASYFILVFIIAAQVDKPVK